MPPFYSSSFLPHLRLLRHLSLHQHHRSLSSFPPLDLTHPTFIVFGSNTSVGKTLISAGLASSVLSSSSSSTSFLYLKPVQTGFPLDSDSRFVHRKVSDLFRLRCLSDRPLFASNHIIRASAPAASEFLGSGSYEEVKVGEGVAEGVRLVCKTLYGWKAAISPHLAVEKEGMEVEDSELREMVAKSLEGCLGGGGSGRKKGVWRLIEMAGGVASPGPSGTLQCDLYR